MILPVSPVSRRDWTTFNFGAARKWVSRLSGLCLRGSTKMCYKLTHPQPEQFNPHTKEIACNIANNCTHITCLSLSTHGGMSQCHLSITCNSATEQWNNHIFYHNGYGSCSGSAKAGSYPLLQTVRTSISHFQGEWRWKKPDYWRIFFIPFFCDKILEVMKPVGTGKKCLMLTKWFIRVRGQKQRSRRILKLGD